MANVLQNKTLSFALASLFFIFLTGIPNFNAGTAVLTLPYEGYRIKTVVIDPGHGGKDPGCLGSFTREKDIALAISKKFGARIKAAFPDIKVIFTRDSDVFIPLHERASIANRSQADLFMSIHCNYIPKRNKAAGSETYVMGLHRAKDNLEVAKRENAVILQEENYDQYYDGYDPNSNEGHIILSMFQNAFLEQSILLAKQIEDQLGQIPDKESRGVKQAGFLVLRQTTMPSVLIETGFLSHDREEKFLSENANQDRVAESLFQAFVAYKELVEDTGEEISATPEISPGDNAVFSSEKAPKQTPDDNAIVFKVQIAASSGDLDIDEAKWKDLPPIERKQEDNYYKYLVGPYKKPEKATEMQKKLRKIGFPDAFLVAYRGETRISVQDAMQMLQDK